MPDDLHEWVSFEDNDEDRTWTFDVTFLTSNWTCIFGRGCQGVLTGPTPELEQGCCSYGAHFVDDEDVANTEAHVARLTPDVWQFHAEGADGVVTTNDDGETVTRQVDDACIMLNRPGFPGGAGCALHRAADEAGERFLDWKPTVCWQLPLRRHDEVDDHGHVTSTIREWKRRDWGEGGAHFHWWCTADSDAFVGSRPTYVELRDELVEMTSPWAYDRFVAYANKRREQAAKPSSPVFLPHPAVRRR